jgi:hypothetical protein
VGSVVVVIPSRSRPQRAWEAVTAARETAVLVSTSIVLAVDADDPELPVYRALQWRGDYAAEVTLVVLEPDETGNLVRATNTVSMRIATEDPDAIIGNLGDDHLCRTLGWDRMVADALRTPGIAYGRDGIQDEALPTAPFISARIVLALGYYFLPDVTHMYVDNAVRDVGAQTGTLRYLPGMVIEHMHPFAGKAAWDAGYEAVNAETPVREDRLHYESWREHAMPIDIGRVRAMLEAAA